MTRRSDPNPAYWEQYGPFQHVKHELIRCYLNGWYPKLGTWARRVLYVDTHAGRGRYESGDPGSPVLALQTLLRHAYREKLLNASKFRIRRSRRAFAHAGCRGLAAAESACPALSTSH